MKKGFYCVIYILVLLLLASCSSTRYVPDGSYLLDDVRIRTDNKEVKPSSLSMYVRQNPNSKWFSLFKTQLYVYNWSGPDSTRWINRVLRKMGDALVATSVDFRHKSFLWWVRAFLATALSWTSRFMVVFAIFLAFGIDADQVMIVARQLVVWVVLTVCPTPGGSGVSEWIFKQYYGDMISSGALALVMALCWRVVSYYIYLIIGICVIPSWLRKWKKKRMAKKEKNNGNNDKGSM